jgi:putative membrane protein
MATEGSLNHSMNSALKHYSSMFFLPSYKKSLLAIAVICIGIVGLSTFALFSSKGLTSGLALGISLFALTLIADSVVSKVILKVDPIYLLRRTLVLSLFCWLLWLLFIAIGVALGFAFGSLLWIKLCLLGYAAVVTLRGVVLIATSSATAWRKLVSVLLNPTLCIVVFLVFWAGISNASLIQVLPFLAFLVISPIIGCLAVFLFLSSIDRLGQKTYSIPSLPLFRAFMLNWVVGLNAPLEEIFEKTGQNADIEVTLLKFDSSKPKAAVILPLVHPGPFKNIGSSLLPSLLKHEFEKEFGCDACVPLGILGHELDLASQAQNHKIVWQVIASAKFKATADLASPFVKVTEGVATASCQIFGDTVFLSFTLAPKTTEDLPQELGRMVSEEAAKYGLKSAMVINTHNSINDIVDTEEYLDALQMSASKCLQKAVALQTERFMVGAATVFPKEFNLKDGMGTGGITAIVVQVEKQKTAYVVIDGNNMISGLREKILAALTSVGFGESEVFTTDTHAVSAIVTGRRGYHPVGEVMSHEILTRYICEVAKKAEANLETSKAGCIHFVVPQVRVIGETRLQSMTILVDKSIQKAKQTLLPVFGLEGLVLILLLLLL